MLDIAFIRANPDLVRATVKNKGERTDVDAILGYRDEAGNIDDPLSLVTAEVLSARKLEAIASFLIVFSSSSSPTKLVSVSSPE